MTDSSAHDLEPEARAFRIIPGDPDSRVIIHVPHASREIPDAVRAGVFLDDAALDRELDAMTDGFTDVIAENIAATASVRPWLFVNDLSRLVIDPERFPDDREEMNAVDMGAVYTRTSDGFVLRDPSADEISGLVVRYFEPYAAAFTELVDRRLRATGGVTIIDLHSFPLHAPRTSCTATGRGRRSASAPTHFTHRVTLSHRPAPRSPRSRSASTPRSPAPTCRSITTARTSGSCRSCWKSAATSTWTTTTRSSRRLSSRSSRPSSG